MRTNPPWTDKIISQNWAAMVARVGAKWMPLRRTEPHGVEELRKDIAQAQAAADKGMTDSFWMQRLQDNKLALDRLERKKPKGFKEYGCGHYGCVMPTETPGLVIKISTDPTEAAFVAAYLSMPPAQRPAGIVPYHRLFAIRSTSRMKRPVFVLWREEADYVGKIGYWIGEQARESEKEYYRRSHVKVMHMIGNCLDAGREVRKRIINKPDAKQVLAAAMRRLDEAWELNGPPRGRDKTLSLAWSLNIFKRNADDLQGEVMGNYIGRGLSESFDAGLLLADVHTGNIGMPMGALAEEIGRTPIITDPGHAIALDDRYAGVRVEDL